MQPHGHLDGPQGTRVHLFMQMSVEGRTAHWVEILSRYDITIKYHKGKENLAADALSRDPGFRPSQAPITVIGPTMATQTPVEVPSTPPMTTTTLAAEPSRTYRDPPKPDEMLKEDNPEDTSVEQLVTLVKESEEIMPMHEEVDQLEDLAAALTDMKLMVVDARTTEDRTMHVVILHPHASLPTPAHVGDAGYDVTTPNSVILRPQETTRVPLGIAVEALPGMFLKIEGRSGLAVHGIQPKGGIVD
ncbi:hypothetical protein GGI19_005885 [Coemansia pectinata]|uniref:dUTPase-like domain-containing protein n=1 Tax=Coemansia pectinata TaxID=1052879 RepID=A0A9W8GTF9_9FUNG|nr:hypothetical protein GGI19_005885 [Coemansia pectinata]